MNSFRIKTDQCKHSIESFKNISEKMVGYSNDIDGVVYALSFMDKSITRALRASQSKIINDGKRICVLTDSLSRIVERYAQTEKLICNDLCQEVN